MPLDKPVKIIKDYVGFHSIIISRMDCICITAKTTLEEKVVCHILRQEEW